MPPGRMAIVRLPPSRAALRAHVARGAAHTLALVVADHGRRALLLHDGAVAGFLDDRAAAAFLDALTPAALDCHDASGSSAILAAGRDPCRDLGAARGRRSGCCRRGRRWRCRRLRLLGGRRTTAITLAAARGARHGRRRRAAPLEVSGAVPEAAPAAPEAEQVAPEAAREAALAVPAADALRRHVVAAVAAPARLPRRAARGGGRRRRRLRCLAAGAVELLPAAVPEAVPGEAAAVRPVRARHAHCGRGVRRGAFFAGLRAAGCCAGGGACSRAGGRLGPLPRRRLRHRAFCGARRRSLSSPGAAGSSLGPVQPRRLHLRRDCPRATAVRATALKAVNEIAVTTR